MVLLSAFVSKWGRRFDHRIHEDVPMRVDILASRVGGHNPTRFLRLIGGVLVGVLVASVLVGVSVIATPAAPASAATAANWDPGFIIDDSIFYDSSSMDAGSVQSFLNAQVSQCQTAAYTCLKGYGVPTETRPADRFCASAYQGAAYQTAAQIIDGVAKACGINQRVLLVLLQKEQGLVTSTAPSARAFAAATGMSCPDTAGCDPQYAGFFYQVYFAARQFQVYRLSTNFGYQAGRVNDIKLNPDASCGTQSVYIYNQATAALYTYTPYTPNAAALSNLYGIGDACSAYGNRNFWRIFSDWFGDPHHYTVADGFASYWNAHGGATGSMGNPTSYLVMLESSGGSYQRFQGGTAYASYGYGTAFVANNVIGAQYAQVYGPTGPLSWPTSEQMCAPNGVCFQSFAGGAVTTAAATGTQVVWGGLGQFWAQSGGPYSLGAALAPMNYYQQANGAGWVQRFQGGSIAQSAAGIIVVPHTGIESAWLATDSGRGFYGWPTSATSCVSTSCAQTFQGGVLSTSVANGTHAILWGVQSIWKQSGGINGLGVALTDLRGSSVSGTGWVQQFSSAGVVLRPDGTMTRIPYGGIWNTWAGAGAEASFGWPTAAAACVGTACGQRFQYSEITTSPQGNFVVVGGFVAPWESFGGLATVGPAIASLRYAQANGGGWSQRFAGGVVTQVSASAPIFTPAGPILTTWQHYGAEGTWLGWPIGTQQCSGTSCTQQFQHGRATSNTGGVMFSS